MSIFINGWDKQKVIEHIISNYKGKSVDKFGNCCYKTVDGKKCAVGMFIPNNLYRSDLEGKSFNENCSSPLINSMPMDVFFMRQLQIVHDYADGSFDDEETRTDEEILMDIISEIESYE